MLFNSVQFILFFPLVALLYYIMPKRLRIYWLLIASYYFYMCWNAKYALLIAFSTGITWIAGILLERVHKTALRKMCVAGCVLLNFSLLFVFKYLNFVIENVDALCSAMRLGSGLKTVDLLLPVGISFYTFQAVGYVADVYRGDVAAEKNPFRYALFISFFPQLVAGPIERAGNMLKQIRNAESGMAFDAERIKRGLLLMGYGLFQKIVVSDRLALIVDEVYGNYGEYGMTTIAAATIFFGFQIYCDFAGYTNIARGAARVMGFELTENFRQPYLALSIKDFWKRWHISLTSWFRDYLYIPLGGNRKGKLRKCLNTAIVFLVSGIWHGAGWNFLAWGAIHGAAQICSGFRKEKERMSFSCKIRKAIVTFAIVDFAWLFFRADSISHALRLLKQMTLQIGDFSMLGGCMDVGNWRILILGMMVLIAVDVLRERGLRFQEALCRQEIWFRYVVYLFLICSCIYLGVNDTDSGAHQFIYFQF